MGNGPGLKDKTVVIDIETGGLDDDFIHSSTPPFTLDQLENAAAQAAANFGRPTMIFGNVTVLQSFFNGSYLSNPQFEGTEWAHMYKLTKRQEAFAKLQVFLVKIGLQRHLEDEEARRADCDLAVKRLKRAKWARYQKKA